jgi:hypothetical protein
LVVDMGAHMVLQVDPVVLAVVVVDMEVHIPT